MNNTPYLKIITLNEALSDLQQRGFSYTFRLNDDCAHCNDYRLGFEDFDILEIHRFENSAADECAVLYAIECDKYKIKGVIINAPGTYTSVFSRICIDKILNNDEFRYQYTAE